MAQIPYKQRILPSANVGAAPLPLSGADTGAGAIGQGISSLGAGVSNFTESMVQIKKFDNQNKDSIAETKLRQFEQAAKDRYSIKINNDGNQDNWEKYAKEEIDTFNADNQSLVWGTEHSKNQASLTISGIKDNFTKQVQLQVIEKRANEATKVQTTQLINDISSLENTPEQIEHTKNSEAKLRSSLSSKYGPELVEQVVTGVKIDGLKGKVINMASAGRYDDARKLTDSMSEMPPQERESLLNSVSLMERTKNKQNQIDIDKAISIAALDRYKFRNLEPQDRATKGNEIITNASKTLSGKDLEIEIEKTEKFIKGETETKHPLAVSAMQTAATDIWRGANTKQKFDEEVARRKRLPDSDPNALSDTEFSLVTKDADTELAKTQAQIKEEAKRRAMGALVDYETEQNLFLAIQGLEEGQKQKVIDKRKLQLELVNQYNDEMGAWLANPANKDKSGKEFEQFRDAKRYDYINHRTEFEKNLRVNIETANPKTGKATRKPNETVTEYLKRTGQE